MEDIAFKLLQVDMIYKDPVQDVLCKRLMKNMFCKYHVFDMYVKHHAGMPMAAGSFVSMDVSQECQDSDVTSERSACSWFQLRKSLKIMDLAL